MKQSEYQRIVDLIDQEGLDYYLRSYESPEEYRHKDSKLYKMWRAYIDLVREFESYLETKAEQ